MAVAAFISLCSSWFLPFCTPIPDPHTVSQNSTAQSSDSTPHPLPVHPTSATCLPGLCPRWPLFLGPGEPESHQGRTGQAQEAAFGGAAHLHSPLPCAFSPGSIPTGCRFPPCLHLGASHPSLQHSPEPFLPCTIPAPSSPALCLPYLWPQCALTWPCRHSHEHILASLLRALPRPVTGRQPRAAPGGHWAVGTRTNMPTAVGIVCWGGGVGWGGGLGSWTFALFLRWADGVPG